MNPLIVLTILGAVLAFLKLWFLPRYGDWTIGCSLGMHKGCDLHLKCACPHHSDVLWKEFESV